MSIPEVDAAMGFIHRSLASSGEVAAVADHPPAQPELPGPVPVENLFLTPFVHDALETVVVAERLEAVVREQAEEVRRRCTAFLKAHEDPEHTWRFFGHGFAIDPDVDTTACCAVAVAAEGDASAYLRAVEAFRGPEGLFASYVDARGHRYSWILPGGAVREGYDRVVNANVARLLGIAGLEPRRLWQYLELELRQANFTEGSPDYPNGLSFAYMASRAAWASGRRLSAFSALRVASFLDACCRELDAAQSPLSAVLAILCDLYLGRRLDSAVSLLRRLREAQASDGGWAAEPFCVGGFRSRALTTALALEAILRHEDAASAQAGPRRGARPCGMGRAPALATPDTARSEA